MVMIAIIDYGMGNLRSVEKGFEKVRVKAKVVSTPHAVRDADALVLPGVGAFRDCMRNLEKLSLIDPILTSLRNGKPYLGICLGLQVLFTESEEFGSSRGFNIFKGKVVRFRVDLKVPHMGWNTVNLQNNPPLFQGIMDESFFYFVHSYYVVPEDASIVAGTTDYGVTFTSMIWKDNIFATQFHPEKSQDIGLNILKNFGNFAESA
jgi:glutamine amidotransferase